MPDITTGYTWASGATVTPSKLNDQIGNAVISPDAITTAKIIDGAVTAAKILDANVTASKIADGSVGSTKIAGETIHGQPLVTTLADADECMWYKAADGTLQRITKASLTGLFQPAGAVIHTVAATPYTANVDITAVVALTTTPTTSNGTEIINASITPSSSSNKILVHFSGCACSTAGFSMAALFCGNTLLNVMQGVQQVAGYPWNFTFSHIHSPASTSAQTYSIRVAPASAGAMRFNGGYNGAHYGTGTSSTNLILQEIKG